MDNRQVDLCKYRIQESKDTLKVAENCLRDTFYKDAINRSYYSAFYAIKAVLALGVVDFKRHKDVIVISFEIVVGSLQRYLAMSLKEQPAFRDFSMYLRSSRVRCF